MSTSLALRVQAVNEAHALAMEWYDLLVPIFTPFVGQAVLKADGGLLAKVQKLVPELPYRAPGPHVWRDAGSAYTIRYGVRCHAHDGGSGHASHEASIYVGELSGTTLVSIMPRPELRTDYTVEEVVQARDTHKKLKAAADVAFGKLHHFGEYDR